MIAAKIETFCEFRRMFRRTAAGCFDTCRYPGRPQNEFARVASEADPAAIHYSPAENLEHIDVALIDTARQEIDIAAYVLTDWPVIQALTRAADRGVTVRVYLDKPQLANNELAKPAYRRNPHQARQQRPQCT